MSEKHQFTTEHAQNTPQALSSPDPAAIQRFVDLLYPDAPEDSYLVFSTVQEGKWLSRWLHPSQLPQVCGPLATQAARRDIYINLGLRHPTCTPTPDNRGASADVYAIGGLWMDLDHSGGRHSAQNLPTPQELLAFIQGLPFRCSLLVDSSGGIHAYALFKELWLLDTDAERDAAALLLRRFQRTIQAQAAAQGWKADSTADLARVLRPAGTLNHKRGTPQPVTILHEDPIRYNPSAIADAPWLATIEDTYTPQGTTGDFPPAQLAPLVHGCAWLQHCRDDAATLPEPEWHAMLGIVGRCVDGPETCHEWSAPYPRYSKAETARKLTHALADAGPRTCAAIRYDLSADAYCRACPHWGKVKSPLVLGMAKKTPSRLSSHFAPEDASFSDPHRIRPKGFSSLSSLSSLEWPKIAPEAFHGVAGTIVQTIAPHSEADPVSLLLQLLTYFGVVVGRQAYYQVEATQHYVNLYTCLVGATSKARKGTAYDHIAYQMRTVDTSWTLSNISSGCGSGEGLIAAVKDQTIQREPIRERKRIVGYQEVEVDPGVIDKRLLVYEPEFSSVLKVTAREGNILSAILRQAWDSGHLRNTVKTNPMKATGAHIAIISHITIEELQRLLTTTEIANGFANRFLWCCVQRSGLLPDGGALDTINFQPLLTRLREVFRQAKALERMRRDAEATAAWHAVYPTLSEGKPGLVGALLARGEAQVLRLSMLYALLDGSVTISACHLNAALAVWEYCEASAAYIFGSPLGDPAADTLLTALKAAYPAGLSRKVILEETFQRHVRADELDRVLRMLDDRKCITVEELPPDGGKGRPKTLVKYVNTSELSEQSEFNRTDYLSMSKDAVKSMALNSQSVRVNCELNAIEAPPEADAPALETPPTPPTSAEITLSTYPDGSPIPPCADCLGVARWQDRHGVYRCVACYPPPNS